MNGYYVPCTIMPNKYRIVSYRIKRVYRPRIPVGLESLLEHFIFLNFLGEGPPNPQQEEVATHKFTSKNFEPLIYKSYIRPCYNRSVTV